VADHVDEHDEDLEPAVDEEVFHGRHFESDLLLTPWQLHFRSDQIRRYGNVKVRKSQISEKS
jgi:hypothetical protein